MLHGEILQLSLRSSVLFLILKDSLLLWRSDIACSGNSLPASALSEPLHYTRVIDVIALNFWLFMVSLL
jgi:hypothetical protein